MGGIGSNAGDSGHKAAINRADAPGEKIESHLSARYLESQYAFIQFLTEHLSDCSRAFEGDLIEMLVLAIIGQAALEGHTAGGAFKPVNASRISDLIGVPRQTVRRKLLKMEERGWIAQNAEAGWALLQSDGNTSARRDLEGLDKRGIQRLAKLHVAIKTILDRTS